MAPFIQAALPEALYYKIPNPRVQNQDLDYFGSAIAGSGSHIAVGSPRAESDGGMADGGTVWVSNASSITVKILENPYVGGGGRFGHSVAFLSDTVLAGAPENPVNGNSLAGAAYYCTVSGSQSPVPLNNPNPEGFEYFGQAVAISSTHAVVSARGINTSAAATGIVHVYDRTGGSPSSVAYSIPNPAPTSGGFFGTSLALSGTRLIVGVPDALGGRGIVYVYDLTAGQPTGPSLILSNPQDVVENEEFGCALSLDGQTLAVGARGGLGLNGRAYVFDLSGTTPSVPILSLANPDSLIWEAYGSSLAVRSNRLLVGCPADIQNGNFIGSVYEYDLSSATPSAVVFTITSPSSTGVQGGETFGGAVCWAGSSNEFRVIGAPGNDTLQPDAGDVHVFRLSGATLVSNFSVANTIHKKRTFINDTFGEDMCLMGNHLFVANKSARSGGYANSGCFYQYDLASATPTVPVRRIDNPAPGPDEYFGSEMVAQGTRLVISALHDDVNGVDKVGTVYVYELSGSELTLVLTIPNPIVSSQSYFGGVMALDGDTLVIRGGNKVRVYNLASATPAVPLMELGGTSFSPPSLAIYGSKVVIGSGFSDISGTDAGSVSVYDLESLTPQTPIHLVLPPNPIISGYFGRDVALNGDKLVVADFLNANHPEQSGHVYLYDLSNETPNIPLYMLQDPITGSADDRLFASSIAFYGNRILCGCPNHDFPGTNSGIGYIYGVQRAMPEQVAATLQATDGSNFYSLGSSVALNDDWAVMGSTELTAPSTGIGTVRVYSFPKPEIVIEQTLGVPLTDGISELDYGYCVQTQPTTIPLTIKNTGIHPLEITEINFITGNDIDFSTSVTGLPLSISAGGSSVIPVTFTAGVLGARTTELRLLNNDEDEGPFNIILNAFSVTDRQAWRQQYFGTIENTGDAANSKDPDGDGSDNSFEFLTGSIPTDPSSRFRLDVKPDTVNPGQKKLQISPTRNTTNYRIEFSPDLAPDSWQTLWEGVGSGAPQMHVEDPGSFNANKRFYRAVIW